MVYYTVSRYNEDMFLVGILTWWYGDGWRQRLHMIQSRIMQSSDYFSIGLLLSTLFAPFRQISAEKVDGALAVQLRAMFDLLISRLVGGVVRIFMLLFGVIFIAVQIINGAIVLVAWLIIPLFPVIGLIMTVIGWTPVWR
jgi:hypothetical protein